MDIKATVIIGADVQRRVLKKQKTFESGRIHSLHDRDEPELGGRAVLEYLEPGDSRESSRVVSYVIQEDVAALSRRYPRIFGAFRDCSPEGETVRRYVPKNPWMAAVAELFGRSYPKKCVLTPQRHIMSPAGVVAHLIRG